MTRLQADLLVKGICGEQFALITLQNLIILDGTFTIQQLTAIAEVVSNITEEPEGEES